MVVEKKFALLCSALCLVLFLMLYLAPYAQAASGGTYDKPFPGDYTGVYKDVSKGAAVGGKVQIVAGDVMAVDVYGGWGKNGVTDNSVVVSGGTVRANVSGGSGGGSSRNVTDNSVVMTSGEVSGNVYGGASGGGGDGGIGLAAGNSVTVSGGKVGGGVYGGVNTDGAAMGNRVVISGGEVGGEVLGGSADAAMGNSVVISGGKVRHGVLGGISSGAVTGNNVAISGGEVGFHVYGGSAGTVAVGNRVVISGGKLTESVFGGSSTGSAMDNSVEISGGDLGSATISGLMEFNVYGGHSTRTAMGNSVAISGGTVTNSVYGGESTFGTALGNRVTISGGTVGRNVYGGYSNSGSAMDNSVEIRGGEVGGDVFGGSSSGGSAANNRVVISGGKVTGNVYGGFSNSVNGAVTNNSVTILGKPVFGPSTVLHGGATSGSGSSANATLNIFTRGIAVFNISNFQHYNFLLPMNGRTGLSLTDTAGTIIGSGRGPHTINVYAPSGNVLNVGHKATLLHSAGNLTSVPAAWQGQTGQTRQGVSLLYDYSLSFDANNIYATVTGVQAAPETRALSESRASSLAFANLGADLIAGAGLANARTAGAAASPMTGLSGSNGGDSGAWGLAPFFALSTSSMRYNNGSQTNVSGMALMAGLAKMWQSSAADVLAGVFFEAAFGGYNAHTNLGAGSVDGKGDTKAVGGGILARLDMTDTMLRGLYTEASFRIGNLSSTYRSDDLRDAMGTTAAFDSQSTYYGAHGGGGYVWNFANSASIDLYGKYFWTHQTGQNVTLFSDAFKFKDVDSHRIRLGGRVSYTLSETLAPYLGAAWEYEFDGTARATTYGFDVPAPSGKGATAVGEVGLNWTPEKAPGFSVDLSVQGYTGMREGVSGSLQLRYEF